ncbi:MAG: thiamine phosphate synthase [Casimicrobiaceae bacterium]
MQAQRATLTPRPRLQGLYAVTPDTHETDLLVAKVTAALLGGAQAIQYRNKTGPAALKRDQAQRIARLCAQNGVLMIVNDDPELAAAVGADGVHLGRGDGDVASARAQVGETRLIGVSCYGDMARAQHAVEQGADYVAFGSFFPSRVKREAAHADSSLLTRARMLGVPVVAIGGITAGNVRLLVDAGADAVAVITDVFGYDEPAAVTRAAAAIATSFSIKSPRERHD